MLVSGKGLLGWKRPKIQAVSVGSALFLQTTFFNGIMLGELTSELWLWPSAAERVEAG